MKNLLSLVTCVLSISLVSCSTCNNLSNSYKTPQQGAAHAKLDILKNGYTIYRYDMPAAKAEDRPKYSARYEHFGIKTCSGGRGKLTTLPYMKSWNNVMDSSLIQKYGSEYIKYRTHLIPSKNAPLYDYERAEALEIIEKIKKWSRKTEPVTS